MTNPIAIYGAGGLGREVLSVIRAIPEWNVIGFFDDGLSRGLMVDGIEVLGGIQELSTRRDLHLVVAIADPIIKQSITLKLESNSGILFPTLIHPSAILQDRSNIKIGHGTIITAGCILTTGIVIGKHVLVNLNCTIGHDVVIGDYVSIMPGVNLAGKVRIGKSALLGSGVQIIKQSNIGDNATVGSGAVVTKDVSSNTIVVGIPARVLKK